MKLLKQLFKVFSPSGMEGPMIHFLWQWITENVPEAHIELDEENCNIYITKGQGPEYPCMAAHLDQVQKIHSCDFQAIETRDIIFGWSPKRKSLEGLGADDKVGIWCCLKCLLKYDNLKVAFFSQEETGCMGSENARLEFFSDCRFVIEPDRRGSSDLITSIMGDLCSEEFLADIDYGSYGYKPTDGLSTDIEALKENGLSVSCINLSCGYYEPHTDHEFIVKKDVKHCLKFIQHIIDKCIRTYPHVYEYTFDDIGYGRSGFGSLAYWEAYDELYDIISQNYLADPTLTPDELYTFYHDSFPKMDRDDFAQLLQDVTLDFSRCDLDGEWIEKVNSDK